MSLMDEFLIDPIDYSSHNEVFDAAVGEAVDENMLFSREWYEVANGYPIRSRNESIKQLVTDGIVPEDYIHKQEFRGRGYAIDYDSLALSINRDFDLETPVKTGMELFTERKGVLAERRSYREDVFSRGKFGSGLTRLSGGLAGLAISPENIAAMLVVPATGVYGTSRALYSLAAAKRGAIIGTLTAAAVEPFIYSWKKEIDAPYTFNDAFFNIAASGILNGTVDGIGASIGYNFKMKGINESRTDYKKLVEIFRKKGLDGSDAEVMATFVRQAAGAPDPKMKSVDYVNRMNDAAEALEVDTQVKQRVPDELYDDPEFVSSALDEMDDGFYYVADDGKHINYKDADIGFDKELSRIKQAIGCLANG